MSYKNLCTV